MRRGTELAKEQGIDNVHFQVICCCCAHAAPGVMPCDAVCGQLSDMVLVYSGDGRTEDGLARQQLRPGVGV